MAFPPKRPYAPKGGRPPNSPEPGDKPDHKRTFDMRPKPSVDPRYEPRLERPDPDAHAKPSDDAAN